MESNDPLTLFCKHLELRGRSQRTQVDYRRVLERFSEYMALRGPSIQETNLVDIAAYNDDLRDRRLSPTAQRLYLTVLRVFFHWCLEEGWVDKDPTRRVRRPDPRSTMVKIPPYELFRKLLDSVPARRTMDLRDRTILLMPAGCPSRPGHRRGGRRGLKRSNPTGALHACPGNSGLR